MKTSTERAAGVIGMRRAGVLVWLSLCLAVAFFSSQPAPAIDRRDWENDRWPGERQRPAILLTGFEPFGQGRPLNPSWEAIKGLDGQPWKGYVLVCRRLPVVWGAPREYLEEWIAWHQPVAIFSFGQGGNDSFAIESKASNLRGKHTDNHGVRPIRPKIAEQGPEQFQATIACEAFKDALTKKGYKVRVSTAAGQYLCEETLYTLEFLKWTKKLEAKVMFCHVPSLNAKLGDQVVTAEYVQQFIKDLLLVWHTTYVEPRVPVSATWSGPIRVWGRQPQRDSTPRSFLALLPR
jgi:pyroglutamyl-peptidase